MRSVVLLIFASALLLSCQKEEMPAVKRVVDKSLDPAKDMVIWEDTRGVEFIIGQWNGIGDITIYNEDSLALSKSIPEIYKPGDRMVRMLQAEVALLISDSVVGLRLPAVWVPKEKWRPPSDPEYEERLACTYLQSVNWKRVLPIDRAFEGVAYLFVKMNKPDGYWHFCRVSLDGKSDDVVPRFDIGDISVLKSIELHPNKDRALELLAIGSKHALISRPSK